MIWTIIIAILVLFFATSAEEGVETPIWMKILGVLALLYLMFAVCSAC